MKVSSNHGKEAIELQISLDPEVWMLSCLLTASCFYFLKRPPCGWTHSHQPHLSEFCSKKETWLKLPTSTPLEPEPWCKVSGKAFSWLPSGWGPWMGVTGSPNLNQRAGVREKQFPQGERWCPQNQARVWGRQSSKCSHRSTEHQPTWGLSATTGAPLSGGTNKTPSHFLAGWLIWLEWHPIHQMVEGSMPGTNLDYRFDPRVGHVREQPISISLSLSLSLFQVNKHILRWGFKKEILPALSGWREGQFTV